MAKGKKSNNGGAIVPFVQGAAKAKNFFNQNKDIIMPIAAAVGDAVLTNSQRQFANTMLNKLNNSTMLRNLDTAIDRFAGERSGSQLIPHVSGAPVNVGTRIYSVKPKFRSIGQTVQISHREALGTVNTTTTDVVINVGQINAFNPYVFPWLSTIAGSYDRYKINGAVIEYVPTCPTSQGGAVTLAWDPAASDATPDFYDLTNMHSTQVSSWCPAKLAIPASKILYMAEQTASSASDLFNHGSLFVGAMGGGNTSVVGQLYINYTVQLYDPQPTSGLSSVFTWNMVSGTPFSTVTLNNGFAIESGANGILVPMGTWKLEVYIAGTTITSPTFYAGGGVATSSIHYGNSGSVCVCTVFLKSSGGTTSTASFAAAYATYTYAQARLTRVDPNSYANAGIAI